MVDIIMHKYKYPNTITTFAPLRQCADDIANVHSTWDVLAIMHQINERLKLHCITMAVVVTIVYCLKDELLLQYVNENHQKSKTKKLTTLTGLASTVRLLQHKQMTNCYNIISIQQFPFTWWISEYNSNCSIHERALRSLNHNQRLCFTLQVLTGIKIQLIAEDVGISVLTPGE